jgi:uncharacterized protein with GYD domain
LVKGTTERDRHKAVEPLLKRHGGRFAKMIFDDEPPNVEPRKDFVFGECELMAFADFPDNKRAAAFAMSVLAGGGVKSFKIMPLLTLNDAIESMKMAGDALSAYVPPQEPSKT